MSKIDTLTAFSNRIISFCTDDMEMLYLTLERLVFCFTKQLPIAYPLETPIPFKTNSLSVFSDKGFSSPKLFFIKLISLFKSFSELLPIH